jgi:hypothetical protein
VSAFLSVSERPELVGLDTITRPWTDYWWDGTDIGAPPITQALGIGACFVVRELVRFNVLQKAHQRLELVYPHCYVPSKKVRDVLERGLGVSVPGGIDGSRAIYNFLTEWLDPEMATFHYSFDLPFRFLADDELLQYKLFDAPVGEPSR